MMRIAERLYQCRDCGNQVILSTNHEGECYPTCKGKCRQILNPNTSREVVLPRQTTHVFIREIKRDGTQ